MFEEIDGRLTEDDAEYETPATVGCWFAETRRMIGVVIVIGLATLAAVAVAGWLIGQ